MVKDLLKFFRNPPKGGNDRGVQTQNPMAPLPVTRTADAHTQMGGGGTPLFMQKYGGTRLSTAQDQTSLRDCFEAGEASSRNRALQSGVVGQTETRNFDRSYNPQFPGDNVGSDQAYDMEAAKTGRTGRVSDGKPAGNSTTPLRDRPHPVYEPNTSASMRSDGKMHSPMPSNNNPAVPNTTSDGALHDGTRDHPSHLIGRNSKYMAKGKSRKRCEDDEDD